ncbi:D-glycero-beta-D-manno-heptose-7-phosphate kinase [Desulfohalobiaceae bacterium Ax17]|nr:D-glycero-beta-D-manno-heptose-7-phosphate kinase [Desulfovulcanus ferrireducens]
MMKDKLISDLNKINGQNIIVIGDIMLDHYQWGHVERISPEAPVPVVSVYKETFHLGGAGNVARNIKSLGGEPVLIALVGKDQYGKKIKELLEKENINYNLIESDIRPTTVKTRVMAHNQQIVRIDQEQCFKMSDDEVERLDHILKKITPNEYVLVSDYGKGLIGNEIFERLKNYKVLLDPKTQNFDIYNDIFIMTPNKKETEEGANLRIKGTEDIIEAGQRLLADKKLKNLLVTLGPDGMALFKTNGSIYHIPTCAQNVYDVTGAGDTVIAVLALCLCCGINLLNACCLANYAAGIVVGEVGTATTTKKEIIETIKKLDVPKITQWT